MKIYMFKKNPKIRFLIMKLISQAKKQRSAYSAINKFYSFYLDIGEKVCSPDRILNLNLLSFFYCGQFFRRKLQIEPKNHNQILKLAANKNIFSRD